MLDGARCAVERPIPDGEVGANESRLAERYHAGMGKRSRTDSVIKVMGAFVARKTWTQADLARAVELGTEALRNVLREMQESGFPLVSEKDHPHVYWRMTKDWYPGGVVFKSEHVPELLRQLSRLPRSKGRERLLATITEQLPGRGKLTLTAPVVTRPASENEEQYVPLVEDAAARKRALWMRYITASRGGRVSERHVSVHVIEVGPPARFVATCHVNGDLRWFRVEGIVRARIDENERYRECAPSELAAFRAASLDGYKGSGAPIACSFFVREPESSWVGNNLLDGMRVETRHGGVRISVETSALVPLARFVVRLGEAARPETPALAQAIAELARGALAQAEAVLRESENQGRSTDLQHDPVRPRSDV